MIHVLVIKCICDLLLFTVPCVFAATFCVGLATYFIFTTVTYFIWEHDVAS